MNDPYGWNTTCKTASKPDVQAFTAPLRHQPVIEPKPPAETNLSVSELRKLRQLPAKHQPLAEPPKNPLLFDFNFAQIEARITGVIKDCPMCDAGVPTLAQRHKP